MSIRKFSILCHMLKIRIMQILYNNNIILKIHNKINIGNIRKIYNKIKLHNIQIILMFLIILTMQMFIILHNICKKNNGKNAVIIMNKSLCLRVRQYTILQFYNRLIH